MLSTKQIAIIIGAVAAYTLEVPSHPADNRLIALLAAAVATYIAIEPKGDLDAEPS